MPATTGRRHFLQLLAGAVAGVPLARRVSAQVFLPVPLRLFWSGRRNVVALDGISSLLLVNGGAQEDSDELLGGIVLSAGKRIDFLFNTDWHPENTGSNLSIGERGGQIVAHEFTKEYLSIDRHIEWQNKTYKPLPTKALPTKTFTKAGSMTFGAQTLQYAPLGQAHTDGDIYVFFRDSNVLVVGDIMTVGKYPIADYTSGGWLGGLITATKTLLDVAGPDTIIVPAEGPLQKRADLQAQYDMLSASRDTFVKMMRQGMSADEMIAAGATKAFDAKWGDPTLFVKTSYRGLWLHVREVGGIV